MPCARKVASGELVCRLLEHLDEGDADDPPLALRVLDPGQVLQEAGARVDAADVERHALTEARHDVVGLAGAEQAVVDEDAGEPIADRLMDERGHDRRVDAAGQPAQDPPVAHPLADAGNPGVDEVLHRPFGLGAADAQDEVAQDLATVDAVGDLGMELQAVDRAVAVAEGRCWRVVAAGERPRGSAPSRVTRSPWLIQTRVAAPADRQQRVDARDVDVGGAELLVCGAVDVAAERQVEHVHAVADAEHGRRAGRAADRAPRRVAWAHRRRTRWPGRPRG